MKGKILSVLLVLSVLVSTGAIGCRKKPNRLTNIPGPGLVGPRDTGPRALGPGETTDGTMTQPGGASGTDQGIRPSDSDFSNYKPDPARFAAETVHFDFDSAEIRGSELPKIRNVAEAMKSMPGNAVRVEGHCDERGTEEYNRSLGERRALAVREQLVTLGLDPNMIPHISYGEERPVDSGHNEDAWHKNRRGEFILLIAPPK